MENNKFLEIYDDIANQLNNILADGEYGSFIDVCAETMLPESVAPNHKLVVWGEENDACDKFYSVAVHNTKIDCQEFSLFSESDSMADLKNTVFDVVDFFENALSHGKLMSDRLKPVIEHEKQSPSKSGAEITLWGRLGFGVKLTPGELETLKNGSPKESQELLINLVYSGRCVMSGDTYFPQEWNKEHLEDELNFDLPEKAMQKEFVGFESEPPKPSVDKRIENALSKLRNDYANNQQEKSLNNEKGR